MSAEFYIKSLFDANHEKWSKEFESACQRRDAALKEGSDKEAESSQQEVDETYNNMFSTGHFRDSFDSSLLFWFLNIDFNFHSELEEHSDGLFLPVAKVKKLIQVIEAEEISELSENWTGRFWGSTAAAGEALEYFQEKKEIFLAFLRQAEELNEAVMCSY